MYTLFIWVDFLMYFFMLQLLLLQRLYGYNLQKCYLLTNNKIYHPPKYTYGQRFVDT